MKWSEKSWSGRDFTTIADLEPWKLSQQKRPKTCEVWNVGAEGTWKQCGSSWSVSFKELGNLILLFCWGIQQSWSTWWYVGRWLAWGSFEKVHNMFHTSGHGSKHAPWTNPRSTASASWCFPDATLSHQTTFYQVANHTELHVFSWRPEDLVSTKVWRIWRFRSWNPCSSDTNLHATWPSR